MPPPEASFVETGGALRGMGRNAAGVVRITTPVTCQTAMIVRWLDRAAA